MLGLIESLRSQGRTICIVEHNLHVVGRLADHVYFMDLGRLSAEGTIEELTGSQRLAEAYFGSAEGLTGATTPSTDALLRLEHLHAGYGRKQVVHDLDLHVLAGEVVTLLGHNGSGKTTTIKTVLGLFPRWADGSSTTVMTSPRAGSRANVKAGMALIPSERFVFPDLTVIENLLLGGANEKDAGQRENGSSRCTSCSRS